MSFPLMPAPGFSLGHFVLKGSITSLNTARPSEVGPGDLAIGIAGQKGDNAAYVSINLGGGQFNQIGPSVVRDVFGGNDASSRAFHRLLDAVDIAGTGFSMGGSDPSGGLVVYGIPGLDVTATSALATAKGGAENISVSAAVLTTAPCIVMFCGFAVSGDIGTPAITSGDTDFDIHVTGKRGDQDSGFAVATAAFLKPVDATMSAVFSKSGGDGGKGSTLHMILIELE